MGWWSWNNRPAAAGPVTGLFPPQAREWALPTEGDLSPKAAQRVAREAVNQPFHKVAQALGEDWGVDWDGKQIQRWVQAMGERLLGQQQAEVEALQRGVRPQGPPNDPRLLVIGMDGGRVQGREKNPDTQSRWREDKVLTISRYQPGDGGDRDPVCQATTYLATMKECRAFGVLARLEAERRGIRQAPQALVIGDGAAWIDTIHQEHFSPHVRIVDYYHAVEHLHDVAGAVYPHQEKRRRKLASRLETLLWRGQVAGILKVLHAAARKLGPPRATDPADHPCRVAAQNVGYFEKHQTHMNYPAYRQRGWPIGSGVTESGVKQFNKRVKGTEQFWTDEGVEAILALRALWLSDDDRWNHYWLCGRPLRAAA